MLFKKYFGEFNPLHQPAIVINDGAHSRELGHTFAKTTAHRIENIKIEIFTGLGATFADDLHRDHSLVLVRI